ncbi:class I SAM-dependent methyltransferase [Novipirellula aureliae]|uniref:class I SAM-dependent methyltransferase n=1 Tax=Novipirellula aureliae TaxID=2527966 RepID=UPI0018CD6AF0|nr:class I SAM-dependent methyltransferase [Novipirellula aureliae]
MPGSYWLDVGGGHAIFPNNPDSASELVSRCKVVVAVDPSEYVRENQFVHESVCSPLEEYSSAIQFDLATMRMVVEHVEDPVQFVASLGRLVKPGGYVVVFTVNRNTPIATLSTVIPFGLHHPIKRLFWGGDEKDTFPVCYRMNSRDVLRELFSNAGFDERAFEKLDDLSTFGRFKVCNYLELLGWSGFRWVGKSYPENCLLGIYQRREE